VTRLDTKKGGAQVKFKESWRALFKWINSLEQCKHKIENMHAVRWREKKQTWERKRRSCSDVESVMVDPVFVCFKYFPPALYLRLLLWFFFPLRQSIQNCRSHWFFLLFTVFSFYSTFLVFFLSFSLLFFSAPFSPVFSSFYALSFCPF
jgi:hypothetical protein